MLCTNAINTSNTIRTQTGAGLTQPLSKISGYATEAWWWTGEGTGPATEPASTLCAVAAWRVS